MFKKILTLLVMLYATLAMAAVDVNKASDAELDGIKGIGPATSKVIMTERKKGEFKSWEDFIQRVKGVGEARAAKLSAEGLTVNGAAFKATATTKKEDKKETKSAAKVAAKEDKKEAKTEAAKPAASAAKAASAKK